MFILQLNVLMHEDNVHPCNFGLVSISQSQPASMTQINRSGGTFRYSSPELSMYNYGSGESSDGEGPSNSRETDVFAFAISMYEVGSLLVFNEPFRLT